MKNTKTLLAKEKNNKSIPSPDVVKLLKQYDNSLKNYHEIQLQSSIDKICDRWPLLDEIHDEIANE